ncbi:MAG: single-stranded DNA-binding protein, partial [Methylobacterium sp.]
EKYTTEVVLQRFRGEMTILDGRGGGGDFAGEDEGGGQISRGGDFGGGRGGDRGGDFGGGRAQGGERRPAPASSGGGGGSRGGYDLDDDIPF